jgi:branched-chain amino acid transport system substrate-binding protein
VISNQIGRAAWPTPGGADDTQTTQGAGMNLEGIRGIRALALLLVSALLLTACATANEPQGAPAEDDGAEDEPTEPAGDEPTADGGETDDQTEAAAGDEEPIKIGASLSLSGDYARVAQDQREAYELWVEQTNEEGGLLGRQVELIVYDDQSTPETGARLYERLINEDEVDLIMGPYSSAVSGGMMPIAERYEMVNIAPMASSDELFQQGFTWSFQVITPASLYLQGALEIMRDEGLTTFAYMGEDTAFPSALMNGLAEEADAGELEMVFNQLYPKGTTDFTSLIAQTESAQPDAVFGGTYAEDAIAITRQMEEQGVNADIIALTVGAAENEYAESVGGAAQHIMGASHWEPQLDTPGNQEFIEAYTEKAGREPGYHAAGSYAGMQILGMAVENCQCVDQAQIRDEIINLETETVFGDFDVDETGAQVAKTGVIIQWIDGEKEIVWPEDIATADYIVPIAPWGER